MEQLISFLFKYRAAVFSKSHFAFGARLNIVLLMALFIGLAALLYFIYVRFSVQLPKHWRIALICLRTALMALLVFIIMRPIIVVPAVLPQSSYVVVLMDDSASMKLPEAGAISRLEALKNLLAAESPFYQSLTDKFKVRAYKFSATAERSDAKALTGEGEQTNLSAAIEQAMRDAAGLPLSAIVVLSDGASNAESDSAANLANTINHLRARNLPIFTLGLGPTRIEGDVEVVRASAPRRVIVGASVTAEVAVKSSGSSTQNVEMEVSEDGHPLRTQIITLQSGATAVARLTFKPLTAGTHRYAFTAKPLEGEPILENNTQELLIEVEDAHPKILYIEGEPRWEYGKLRSAFAEEKNLTLVSVLRSADGKFYRQGVQGSEELQSGFPKTFEELCQYDAMVIGSIEATFFTYDQLRWMAEFVARRGGTLLVLGGAKSLSAGGYVNTPLADLLPVYLSGEMSGDTQTFYAQLSGRGREHPAARLADTPEANLKAWEQLPAITVPEIVKEIKPGATVILEARSKIDKNRVVPLLVEERYGRGRTLAFLGSDTWRWRMEVESKNTSFESFWLNLSRYLVEAVRHKIEAAPERVFYGKREEAKIKVEVSDEKYQHIAGAQVLATVTTPTGATLEVPLKAANEEGFEGYAGSLLPEEDGLYKVEVSARQGDKAGAILGTAQTRFIVGALNREAHDAAQNRDLLKRLATDTGGNYYTLSQQKNLVEDLTHLDNPNSVKVSYDLWDMPFNFLLAVGLAATEWFIRKRKGLA
ncbi:MAG: hypothetical protein HY231_18410 [Acidobacteria bacterium]|nr:hypothetical protein [Acidobacteriota bacterium]